MTKNIRVENACMSNFKANVKVYDKSYPLGSAPDKLVRVIPLGYPTAMTPSDCYITDSRYLVVEEEKRLKERRSGAQPVGEMMTVGTERRVAARGVRS